MPSGEEIQKSLRTFAKNWAGYEGSERGEAQTFLNELLACYGTDRRAIGAIFEDPHLAEGIVDMQLPGQCIVEMKAPREAARLSVHRPQVLAYWHHSDDAASGRPAPPYVVLCAFQQFEVWEPGRFPSAPRAVFSLDELPDHYEALLFLAGADQRPLFYAQRRALTTDATRVVVSLYQSLRERRAAAPETLRDFILQLVWCLFAESLGLISGRPVEVIVDDLFRNPQRSSSAELGELFRLLDDPDAFGKVGSYEGLPYANGGLFAKPARVHLQRPELRLVLDAAEFDWRQVDPTIFGSLLEGCLGRELRWELGAHYTHEVDILKIVRPTIVEPWTSRIDATRTAEEAIALLHELCQYVVLDPACGCGNFLYVAYRELRHLEHALKERIASLTTETGVALSGGPMPSFPIRNILGLEINEFAVQIARVTLWMGHKLAADEFGLVEPVLPLVDLSGIQTVDALATDWPAADAIIGNPPFLGSQFIRKAHGDAYVDWLKNTFKCGVKDYCVYWFRKAQDRLAPDGRAGLVGTNSISQNRARSTSLDYIVTGGGVITNVVSTQKWPGEAKVHVSLVNWVKEAAVPPSRFVLDGVEVSGITSELRTPERSTGTVARLPQNAGHCFQGPIPVGEGFVLTGEEARVLLARSDEDYAAVVRPYLTGDDLADDPHQAPRRWIVDFGLRTLEDSARYSAALAIVRDRVKPIRDHNRRAYYRDHWWRLGEPRPGMRAELAKVSRWIGGIRIGKRLHVAWQPSNVCPSDLTNVFTFDGDFAMGVLLWRGHEAWAWSRSSTLKGDLRYTPSTVFETFPWPLASGDETRRIAEASVALVGLRRAICLAASIGLTQLYNQLDEGAYADLKAAHRFLDEAVVEAYGWGHSVAQDDDEIVRRLLQLNREVASGARPYDPFPRTGPAGEQPLGFEAE